MLLGAEVGGLRVLNSYPFEGPYRLTYAFCMTRVFMDVDSLKSEFGLRGSEYIIPCYQSPRFSIHVVSSCMIKVFTDIDSLKSKYGLWGSEWVIPRCLVIVVFGSSLKNEVFISRMTKVSMDIDLLKSRVRSSEVRIGYPPLLSCQDLHFANCKRQ